MEQQLFCRLVQESFTALPPPASVFWSPSLRRTHEQLGDTRVIIVQLLFSSSLPHSFLHHAGGGKMWHWGNILALSFFSCSASEKKRGGSGRDTFSALNLQQAERCAAVTVVSQLTVVLPQLMRINVTLQKTQKRNHPEGIYAKRLLVVVYV